MRPSLGFHRETPGPLRRALGVLLRMSRQPRPGPPACLLSWGTLSLPSCVPFPLTGLGARGWVGSGLQVPGVGAAHLVVFLSPAFPSSVQLPRWQTYLPRSDLHALSQPTACCVHSDHTAHGRGPSPPVLVSPPAPTSRGCPCPTFMSVHLPCHSLAQAAPPPLLC